MLKLLIVFLLSLRVIMALPPPVVPLEDPIVTISQGQLRGKESYLGIPGLSGKYLAFKGIPYAEPPTGNLRFRGPVPHAGWFGVRDAQEHGNQCTQTDISTGEYTGDEDCLFLNVYTPSLEGRKPVMFFIHGGSYSSGSGDSLGYGPSNFLKEDVVVVTINYRLGIFGFLSTNDSFAPGNYGMKDIVTALNWVQRDIAAFSGNPNDVTIFGESAGGAAVHFLILSPLGRGLFHKAIAESGTALNPWALQPDPRPLAVEVARNLGIDTSSSEAILRGLRSASQTEIQSQVPGFKDMAAPHGTIPTPFAPVVDPLDSLELRFLPQPPLEMIRSRGYTDVPFIIGTNSDEALWNAREPVSVIEKMNANPDLWIPFYWNVETNTPQAKEVIQGFRNTYFGGGGIQVSELYNYTVFHTDSQFRWPIYHTVQLHTQTQTRPVYFYIFSFNGAMNYPKRYLHLTEYPGSMHMDELFYLWSLPIPDPVLPGNPAYTVRSRMIQMWTDFSKTGNPTPEVNSLIKVQWPKATSQMDFLRIDEELSVEQMPNEERMRMWKDMDGKYGP